MSEIVNLEYTEISPGVVSVGVLSSLLNITERRIQKLVEMGVIAKPKHGEYFLAASVRSYINFLQKDGVIDEDLSIERLRQEIKVLKGRSKKLSLENDKTDNLLVDTEEASYHMGMIAKSGLRILETLCDSLESDYELAPEIIEGIEIKIDLYRNEWANLVEGNK